MTRILCPACGGGGYIWNGEGSPMDEEQYDECEECDGEGYVEDEGDLA